MLKAKIKNEKGRGLQLSGLPIGDFSRLISNFTVAVVVRTEVPLH